MSTEFGQTGLRPPADPANLVAMLTDGGADVLRATMDLVPVGMVLLAGDGAQALRVIHANPAMSEIAGVALLPGAALSDLSRRIYGRDRRRPLTDGDLPCSRAITSGAVVNDVGIHVQRPDGSWRVVLASAGPVPLAGGRAGAILVWQDVTERYRADTDRDRLLSEADPQRQLLRLLVANTPAGVAVLMGPEHRYVLVNHAQMAIARGKGELIGRTIAQVWPEAREHEAQRLFDHVYESGEPAHLEEVRIVLERGDGPEEAVFNLDYLPLRGEGGQVTGVVFFSHEITDLVLGRRNAEIMSGVLANANEQLQAQGEELRAQAEELQGAYEELRESEHRLRTILESIPDPIFLKDRDGRLVLANPATFETIGKPVEDALGRNDAELYADATTGPAIMDADRRIMDSGHPEVLEEVMPAHDGQRVYLSTKMPWRDAQGQVIGLVGISRDITERKRMEDDLRDAKEELQCSNEELQAQAEELRATNEELRAAYDELREGEQRYRSLVEMSPDGIFINRDNTIVFANSAALDLFGARDAGDLVGKSPFEVFHPEYHPKMRERIARLLDGESVPLVESRIVRLDGTARDVEVVASPFRDQGMSAIQVVVRDVTERKQAAEALRLNEERLRSIIDNADGIVWLKDLDGRFLVVNDYTARLLGRTQAEIVGRTVFDLFPEGIANEYAANDRQVLGAGHTLEFEERVEAADGCRTYIAVKFPLLDATGRAYALGAICTDVTERSRMAQTIRERDAELRLIMDAAPALISYVDARGCYVRVNRGCEEWFGRGAEDVRGRHIREVAGEEAWRALRPHVERALAGQMVTFEREVTYARSGKRWVLAVYAPDRGESGQVRGFVAFLVDITERKRMEDERGRLAAIIEETTDLVAMADAEGRVLTLNRSGRQMLGLGESEVLSGGATWQWCTAETRALLESEGIPVAVRDGVWSGQATLLSREGREVPVSVLIQAHKRPDGSIEFLSTVARDVSEQRRLEEELRQAQKMEAVGRLAGGVAHDFNNLLTPIIGYSSMLCRSLPPGSRLHQFASCIADSAERAAGLPRQLLAFSRKQVVAPKVMDLNESIASMEKLLRRLIGEDIILSVVPGSGLGQVLADPGQVEQVLLNLAVNARDAMLDGGTLTIETRNVCLDDAETCRLLEISPGPYVMLAVSDTGCGMDKETLSHIFEPFFTTKELGKGTGLGLSTVYGIVRQSNGGIRVFSKPGVGTTFHIYIPLLDTPIGAGDPVAETGGLPGGTETVLLVEDDADVRQVARTFLESACYTVLVAANGDEGVQVARSHPGPIHLLLTDVVMPGVSGRQLADQIRVLRPDTGILFMSGYTDDAIVRHGVVEEGIPLLQKPFTPGVLLRKVREVLDRPATASP